MLGGRQSPVSKNFLKIMLDGLTQKTRPHQGMRSEICSRRWGVFLRHWNKSDEPWPWDPLSAVAQSSYGRTLYRARRYEEAIPHLQRAIELEPQVGLHPARLADVYERWPHCGD